MREGLIIDFPFHGCNKWVVVNVNDCRATVIPLTGKDPNDPSEIFEEAHPSATGISPNSDCKTYGYVKGQIKKREYRRIISRPIATPVVEKHVPVVVRTKRSQILAEALPHIPEDPCPIDPVVASVLNATRGLFSSKGH